MGQQISKGQVYTWNGRAVQAVTEPQDIPGGTVVDVRVLGRDPLVGQVFTAAVFQLEPVTAPAEVDPLDLPANGVAGPTHREVQEALGKLQAELTSPAMRQAILEPELPAGTAVEVWGPNISFRHGATFEVHAAGCADSAKLARRHGGADQGGWDATVRSVAELVEEVYGDQIAEGCPWDVARGDIRVMPCLAKLPEGEPREVEA